MLAQELVARPLVGLEWTRFLPKVLAERVALDHPAWRRKPSLRVVVVVGFLSNDVGAAAMP